MTRFTLCGLFVLVIAMALLVVGLVTSSPLLELFLPLSLLSVAIIVVGSFIGEAKRRRGTATKKGLFGEVFKLPGRKTAYIVGGIYFAVFVLFHVIHYILFNFNVT
ncbi:MAG: hypothetical protein LBG97_01990 [Coriobacteriales bacterium]|nr:hypothetical protein [Coriobacteriales bacterium]